MLPLSLFESVLNSSSSDAWPRNPFAALKFDPIYIIAVEEICKRLPKINDSLMHCIGLRFSYLSLLALKGINFKT